MLTFTEAARQRPVAVALATGSLMTTIWAVGFPTLDHLPKAFLAVLAGTLMAYVTYSKQPGPSQKSFRVATFLAVGVILICLVGLLTALVN